MYYVGKNGGQSGPYPMDELKRMAVSGQLAPVDLVWTDGMSEWKPAGAALPDLFQAGPSAAAPPSPGSPYPPSIPPPAAEQPMLVSGAPISTFLWQSIVVTLLCCLPFGIPAIIYASQVESKRQHGDYAGAMNSSKNAKMWCWIALIVGLLSNLIFGAVFAVKVFAELQHSHY